MTIRLHLLRSNAVAPRTLADRLKGPGILFAISVILCWKLVLTNQYTWLDGPDLAHQVLPWWLFQAGEWHAGRFPLWDPHHWAGQSLIGQAQPGVAYPLNWILFLLPLRKGWLRLDVLHWYFAMIHFIAALNMYALVRYLKMSRTAAIFAGCIFGFTGFLGNNDWPQMLNGGIWAPLVMRFVLKSVRGDRPWSSAAWAGSLLGLCWLSGHHQIPIFLSLTVCAVWVYYVWNDRTLWPRFACFLAFVAMIGALQLLPAYEYGQQARRWVGSTIDPVGWKQKVPYVVHEQYSFKFESLFGLFFPKVATHQSGFMGWVAMTLAALGCLAATAHATVAHREARLWMAIAAGGVLLALGSDSLLHGLAYAVLPMVEKARSPSMAIFIANFGFSVLSAYGIEALWTSPEIAVRPYRVAAVIGAGVLAIGFGSLILGKPIYTTLLGSALVALLVAAILSLWRHQKITRSALTALLLGLLLFEIPLSFQSELPNRYQPDRQFFLNKIPLFQPFMAALRSRSGQPVRVFVGTDTIAFNSGDAYGVDVLNGYLASVTANIYSIEAHTPRGQELFGTAYLIGKEPLSPKHVPILNGPEDLKLYFNPETLPRVRLVTRAKKLADRDEINAWIQNEANDFRTEAVLTDDAPDLGGCDASTGRAKLTRLDPNQVKVEVFTNCKAMLILADTFDGGWKATVDGKPQKIFEVYGAMRGVVIEPGEHEVEMKYRPNSVLAGAGLGILGLVGLIGLSVLRL
jgi:hypothetical protein